MSYYCHSCQDVKHQSKIEHCSAGIICKDCRSEFLEELNDQNYPSLVFEQPAATRHHPYQRHHPYSSSSSSSTSAASNSVVDLVGGGGSGGPDFGSIRVRIGRGGSGGAALAAPAGASAGGVGHGELDQLIQTLFQQVFGIVGDLDDYVMGLDNLDDVVTQLMNQLDGGGPPPASADDLRRIQSVPPTEQQLADRLQCSVCFDEFLAGCATDRLPCQHHFHDDCIRPWLAKHGTCPVCRKSLSGVDTTTQAFATASPPNAAVHAAAIAGSAATSVGGSRRAYRSARSDAPSQQLQHQQQSLQQQQRRSLRRASAVVATTSSASAAAASATGTTSGNRTRDHSSGGGGGATSSGPRGGAD